MSGRNKWIVAKHPLDVGIGTKVRLTFAGTKAKKAWGLWPARPITIIDRCPWDEPEHWRCWMTDSPFAVYDFAVENGDWEFLAGPDGRPATPEAGDGV